MTNSGETDGEHIRDLEAQLTAALAERDAARKDAEALAIDLGMVIAMFEGTHPNPDRWADRINQAARKTLAAHESLTATPGAGEQA